MSKHDMNKRTTVAVEEQPIDGDTNAPRGSTPPIIVKVRYQGPPVEGIHPIVGGVKAGSEHDVDAKTAEALVSSGAFERVNE